MPTLIEFYQVDIDAFEIGDLWQSGVGARDKRSHREHGSDAESDSRRSGIPMQPERHPRQDDDQTRRNVDLYDVVAKTPHEVELASQPRIVTCSAHDRIDTCLFINHQDSIDNKYIINR